jgi:RNA polymerase sigma-70 factor (ECF subfamily)
MQNSAAALAVATYSSEPSRSTLSTLVAQIARGDRAAMETLYHGFAGIRKFLQRRWGADDVEDMVHDTFLETVLAIRMGGLRDPECVWGLARTVARSKVAKRCARASVEAEDSAASAYCDPHLNPEQTMIAGEPIRLALAALSARYREILTRFYLMEQTEPQICAAMGLTSGQFRNIKTRAKERFGEAGKALFN